MFYIGTGKNMQEFHFDETVVTLWDVTVNGDRFVYRGTEQAVLEAVASKFYYEDWHIALRKFLALSRTIVEVA